MQKTDSRIQGAEGGCLKRHGVEKQDHLSLVPGRHAGTVPARHPRYTGPAQHTPHRARHQVYLHNFLFCVFFWFAFFVCFFFGGGEGGVPFFWYAFFWVSFFFLVFGFFLCLFFLCVCVCVFFVLRFFVCVFLLFAFLFVCVFFRFLPKLQGLQEVRDPLCPTVVQWEVAVAEWLRGSNFRERVGNEYVIGATQSFTTSDG